MALPPLLRADRRHSLFIDETPDTGRPPSPPEPRPDAAPASPLASELQDIVCTTGHGFEPALSVVDFESLVGCMPYVPARSLEELARLLGRALGIVIPVLGDARRKEIGCRLRAWPLARPCIAELLALLLPESEGQEAASLPNRRAWQAAFRRALVRGDGALPAPLSLRERLKLWADLREQIMLMRYAFGGSVCRLTPFYLQFCEEMRSSRMTAAQSVELANDCLIALLFQRMASLSIDCANLQMFALQLRAQHFAGTMSTEHYRARMAVLFGAMAEVVAPGTSGKSEGAGAATGPADGDAPSASAQVGPAVDIQGGAGHEGRQL
ncbi:hypothetical protein GT347_22890 [Xylophilus rhododendri]|uniref:Uncharacterized protein n=1 Tax=Xylophilus rhododendri TaxID=2697032 RepID=A0A857J9A8_9BURK|nr:hypothetical protein [Xylophilus rhododendri]QHJ00575.1 hypothetical protein GT347_22890 [Xylophilus rhododendri]